MSYWILDKLNLTPPIIQETNRLETNFGLLSKRKIKDLIKSGDIDDWDDPRLLTLSGLRNKGITPQILTQFIEMVGYTANSSSTIQQPLFDNSIRTYLNQYAPRRMGVLDPIPVKLTNMTSKIVAKPLYPTIINSKTIDVKLNPIVYIERSDFQISANKKYTRLTPGKNVRLKYAGIIKYIGHSQNSSGMVTSISAEFYEEDEYKKKQLGKVNGTIHWVSHLDNRLPLYSYTYPDKTNVTGEKHQKNIYLDDINNIDELDYTHWQLERNGYYYINNDKVIYLVSLKEDPIVKTLT